MKRFNRKTKKNGGYAILFTVVVVGIISMITIGLSNAAYKQMILSSVARDSTTAFYQADIGSECALYADNEYNMDMTKIPAGTTCGSDPADAPSNPGIPLSFTQPVANNGVTSYDLILDENYSKKCFRINVTKTESDVSIASKVQAMGYNICKKSNSRTVERAIEVNY
jgi:hypothetical protein